MPVWYMDNYVYLSLHQTVEQIVLLCSIVKFEYGEASCDIIAFSPFLSAYVTNRNRNRN